MEIIRLNTQAHLEQYNELLRYAFQVTEKTLLDYGWENEDIRQSKFHVLEKARVIGYFDEDRLASQCAVYPLEMNIYGTLYAIGFITSIATYPEYTGMGFMSKLLKKSLEEMRENGESLAILYPYSIPLYRHHGWEIISDKMTFSIKDSQLPKKINVGGYVRRVEDDSPELRKLHNIFARKTHGCLFRNDLAWEEYWRWDVDDTMVAIYYDENDIPTGYVVYVIRDEVMHIKEIIYLNITAWKGLWKYISAHESMVDKVVGNNYSNETISFWLEDSDIKETIRPYIMGRIIDVKLFIDHYSFIAPQNSVQFTLRVRDSFLEWNNKSYTITVNSQGEKEYSEETSTHIVDIDIKTLTCMFLSYKSPTALHKMGWIKTDEETVAILEAILPKTKAYISDYI